MTTKGELIKKVSKDTGVDRGNVKMVLDRSLQEIIERLSQGERVQLVGFGTFYTAHRPEKVGRSMKTGEPIRIKPATVARFKAGLDMRKGVSGVSDTKSSDMDGSAGCRSVFLPGAGSV